MILGFKTHFPWGKPTYFKEKILLPLREIPEEFNGHNPKIHTIRHGNRFKPGDVLHMATGVRTKKYDQFNKGIPGLEKVVSVQEIRIFSDIKEVWVEVNVTDQNVFYASHRKITDVEIDELAANDGFDSTEDFWRWFTTDLSGQLIHWTNKIY